MARRTNILPHAPFARILQNAGAKRVSESAVAELVDIMMDSALEISKRAVDIARHSGRKTVNDGDIKIAVR